MNCTRTVIALALFLFLAPLAHATKCGEVIYNKHGKLRKYNALPLDLSEAWKKYGSSSTANATTETSTASVDPGVSTGVSDSNTQSVSTQGDCKWGGFFGSADRRDFQNYVEQNMNEIKNQMAVGQGGHLEILATFAGCSQAKAFGHGLQKNMNRFVDLSDDESHAFVERIQEVISADTQLSNQCGARPLANNAF